jgi:hypothetical protein
MRDERSLQYPPGSREALEAESAYVAARTVALLLFHASGAVSIGSATAIQLGSYFFLATSAHIITSATTQAPRLEVLSYTNTAKEVKVISRSHPRTTEYEHDVAWLQVAPEVAKASGITWLSMKNLLCGQRFDPYHAFLIQGFPASKVDRGPKGLDLLSLGIGCVSLPPDPGEDFLTLEYPPQAPEDAGLDWPPPPGLSDGGGIWRSPSFRESLIWVPESSLVAIGRSHDPKRARLATTPIERWLSLVAQDFPDLREEIESHLQNSRPTPTALISPHFGNLKLQNPTIDDLVDVLEDRVGYWVLEPARKLATDPVEQYAALTLLLTYFEGIWSYIKGMDSKNRSREFFVAAFVEVFRSGGANLSDHLLQRLAGVLYEDARCGSFHDGMFRERIFLGKPKGGVMHVTLPLANGVIDENGRIELILIDVEDFYRYVEGHFRKLVARLRDPGQVDLRSNFHAMCREKWKYEGEPRVMAL